MKGTYDLIKQIGAMFLALILFVDVARAESLLINVGTTGGNIAINNVVGQSFKVSSPVQLTKISIWIRPELYYITSYHIELRYGEGPGGILIDSTPTISINPLDPPLYLGVPPGVPAYYDFQFAYPITLEANQAYTFFLKSDPTDNGPNGTTNYSGAFTENGNVYSGGQLYWLGVTAFPNNDMTFRVYGNPSNHPPTVNATEATVQVNEGQTATNTGTYSDADTGDNVTLTASVGTITKGGTNEGTWDWSFATADGPADSQTVTITANDGNGGTATTTFELTVNNVAPTVVAGDPISCQVGDAVAFEADFTDPGVPDIHTVEWDYDNDGIWEAGTVDEEAGKAYGTYTFGVTGFYLVTVCVHDMDGGSHCALQTVSVVDTIPPVISCPADITVETTSPDGAIVSFSLPAASDNADPDPDVTSDPVSGSLFPVGDTIVNVTAQDYSGNTSTCSFTVTVILLDTTPPVISINAPEPYGIYQMGSLELDFSATDDIGVTELNGNLTDAAGSCIPAAPGDKPGVGVYTLIVNAIDAAGNLAEKTVFFVVYDPADGFVTGGGWIMSPAGAYVPDPSLAGKANFGFVSKYKKGATEPTGQTEFVFQTAGLNFHSSSYDWLVVAGSEYAMFKGWGSVNGFEGYRFMIWAGDAPDTFRIKIWEEYEDGVEDVIYDNGVDQAIDGGSIVIHGG